MTSQIIFGPFYFSEKADSKILDSKANASISAFSIRLYENVRKLNFVFTWREREGGGGQEDSCINGEGIQRIASGLGGGARESVCVLIGEFTAFTPLNLTQSLRRYI